MNINVITVMSKIYPEKAHVSNKHGVLVTIRLESGMIIL